MTGKRASLVIRLLLGIAIVGVVLYAVEWRDRWSKPGSKEVAGTILAGEIPEDGDVSFLVVDGTEITVPASQVRPGLLRLLSRARWRLFLIAAIPLLITYTVNAYRWLLLSHALSLSLDFGRALRLSFIGLFFNNVVPGATGGDLVRAYYVARSEVQRTESVVAVLMDRIVGLTAMAFQAGVVALFFWPRTELRSLNVGILSLVAGILIGAAIFYSKRGRRLLRLDRIGRRLPLQRIIEEVDGAFFAFRYRKKTVAAAFLLSFLSQGFFIFSQYVVGRSLGVRCHLSTYLLVIPMASIVSSVPLLPGGWGLGDAAYVYLFGLTGLAKAPALAIGILYRLLTMGLSLIGALLLMLGVEGRVPSHDASRLDSPAADL
jgi:hypothetical protein